jgi:hypothetical protein
MHVSLGSGIGAIVKLIEHHPCNRVVALIGWIYLGGDDSIFYLNRWLNCSHEWGRTLEHAIEKNYRDKHRLSKV